MGLNTNQLVTRKDINSLIRSGVFFRGSNNADYLNKCVIKTDLTDLDLVTVTGTRPDNQCLTKAQLTRGSTFTIYYGIYNNKNTSAKLDYVSVQIKHGSEDWIEIGKIDPGTVSSTKTGTITCTIPSSCDLVNKGYVLRVVCGDSNSKQNWFYTWTDSVNKMTSLSSGAWENSYDDSGIYRVSETIKAFSNRIQLDATEYYGTISDSVLNNNVNKALNDIDIYGRAQLWAICFKVE